MLTTSRRLCSIIFWRAPKVAVARGARVAQLLLGGKQRRLSDLVQIDLRDVVEEIGADADFGNVERQLARPRVGLAARGRRVVAVRVGQCVRAGAVVFGRVARSSRVRREAGT